MVNILNDTKVYTQMCLKWTILCCMCFSTIKNIFVEPREVGWYVAGTGEIKLAQRLVSIPIHLLILLPTVNVLSHL